MEAYGLMMIGDAEQALVLIGRVYVLVDIACLQVGFPGKGELSDARQELIHMKRIADTIINIKKETAG